MAKGAHQKRKLPLLQKILLERTDEDHPMSAAQLIAALEGEGVTAERKSIYDDLEVLAKLGLDVQTRKGRDGGWFVGERTFQLAELKLLVDAVQASRFITRRKSAVLIHKLESLASIHQARQLQRQVYVEGRAKTMNESIYYNVDKLHEAIARGRDVFFHYFSYNVKKERVYRREGARYRVGPCGLIWDNQNYYLVGYDYLHGEMRHYRVDKMAELAVGEKRTPPCPAAGSFDIAAYAQKHFGMYGGQEGKITLRCAAELVGVVLDRFGQEVILIPDGEDWFTVTVDAVVSPQFWGWLFGLGERAVIQAPQWAQRAYEERLSQVKAACRREMER